MQDGHLRADLVIANPTEVNNAIWRSFLFFLFFLKKRGNGRPGRGAVEYLKVCFIKEGPGSGWSYRRVPRRAFSSVAEWVVGARKKWAPVSSWVTVLLPTFLMWRLNPLQTTDALIPPGGNRKNSQYTKTVTEKKNCKVIV